MQSFFAKSFGGLSRSYYIRQFLFGAAFSALIFWVVGSAHGGQSIKPGLVFYAVVNTLLYPYSRFVYESVVGYVMGNNVFFVNAVVMLFVKAITMTLCWTMAIFVAPVGLAYLFWRNSRATAD
jgi:glucan phosphoethanolaminetransferase (alkaline phosphatase superfamily)